MKKVYYLVLIVLSIFSCKKAEVITSERNEGVNFVLQTGSATKTYVQEEDEGHYVPYWHDTDAVSAWDENATSSIFTLTNHLPAGQLAEFTGNVAANASGKLRVMYPAGLKDLSVNATTASFTMPSLQTPTASSFDPKADILVSKAYSYEAVDGEVNLEGVEFHRVMALLKINLLSEDLEGEYVRSFKLTSSACYLSGPCTVTFAGLEVSTGGRDGLKYVSAEPKEDVVIGGTGNHSIYLMVPPTNIPGKLTFDIETGSYTIQKEVLLSDPIVLDNTGVTVINLSLSNENISSQLISGVSKLSYKRDVTIQDGSLEISQRIKGVITDFIGDKYPFDETFVSSVTLTGAEDVEVQYAANLTSTNRYGSTTWSGMNQLNHSDVGIFDCTMLQRGLEFTAPYTTMHYSLTQNRWLTYEPENNLKMPYAEFASTITVSRIECVRDDERSTGSQEVYLVTFYYQTRVTYNPYNTSETFEIPYSFHRIYNRP